MKEYTSVERYRKWYATLLRLYPRTFYRRFGREMEQIFDDILKESLSTNQNLNLTFLWICTDTIQKIISTNISHSTMHYSHIIRPILITSLILLIPWIGMQISTEVAWTVLDFILAGILLLGITISYEILFAKSSDIWYRIAMGSTLFTLLFMIWTNSSVGIIGSEDNPINLIYWGLIILGVIGASLVQFRPQGMKTMLITLALVQALVPFLGWFISGFTLSSEVSVHSMRANLFFVALFLGSAYLFHRSKRTIPTIERHI